MTENKWQGCHALELTLNIFFYKYAANKSKVRGNIGSLTTSEPRQIVEELLLQNKIIYSIPVKNKSSVHQGNFLVRAPIVGQNLSKNNIENGIN